MKCGEVTARISAYLDGELDATSASQVRGHLRGCAACSDVAAQEAAMVRALGALPPVEPSTSSWKAIQGKLAALEQEDAVRSHWWGWWQRLRGGAAVGGLVVVAAGLMMVLAWKRWGAGEGETRGGEATTTTRSMGSTAAAPSPSTSMALSRSTSGPRSTSGWAEAEQQIEARYRATVDELVAAIRETPGTAESVAEMERRVGEMTARAEAAAPGRARERAWQELVAYLQRTAVGWSDVALAGGR